MSSTKLNDDFIAKQIYEQIGGRRFMLITGSHDAESIRNGMRLKLIKNKSGGNRLDIILNAADLYDLRFWRHAEGKKAMTMLLLRDIYFENLADMFSGATGLATTMPPIYSAATGKRLMGGEEQKLYDSLFNSANPIMDALNAAGVKHTANFNGTSFIIAAGSIKASIYKIGKRTLFTINYPMGNTRGSVSVTKSGCINWLVKGGR